MKCIRKQIIITTAAVFIGNVSLAQSTTYLGDQVAVDNFAGTTTITGNLIINGNNITNIKSLNALTSISGTLTIQANPNLTSLVGLEGIESINQLFIANNSKLINLSGLNNLTHATLSATINSHEALTSLEGLEGLTTIGNSGISIHSNAMLSTLNGLNNLTTLGGRLLIGTANGTTSNPNPALTNFCAISQLVTGVLPAVTTDRYFVVNNDYNPTYVQLRDSETCMTTIRRGDFTINTQTEINSLGVSLFTSIAGNLTISESTAGAITSLSGLTNITSIGGNLAILDNMALTSVEGLGNLVALGGQLQIGTTNGSTTNSNTALVDFCAISGLVSGDVPQITNASATNEYFVKFNAYNPTYTGLGNSEAASEESRDGCREFVPDTEPPVVSTNTFSKEDGYRFFPNPVSDILFVKSESKITSILISNVSGQEVLKSNSGSINVQNLSKGIYFARIVSGEKTVVEKFVKL